MDDQVFGRAFNPDSRLTPYVLFDLERVAWIAEMRAGELTERERAILRDTGQRLLAAADGSAPNEAVASSG
ncbi:MAG: hypothetical protein ABI468_11050 [Candidatus Nanopelagicales bacterium]